MTPNPNPTQTVKTALPLTSFFSRYFYGLLILALGVICYLAYLLFFAPLISQYQNLGQTVIKEKEQTLALRQSELNKMIRRQSFYESTSLVMRDKLNEFLPAALNLPSLYYNLDQLAKAAGYKMLALTVEIPKKDTPEGRATATLNPPTNSSEKSNAAFEKQLAETENMIQGTGSMGQAILREINIDLTLEGGGYLNLLKFIESLEKNLRLIDLVSFNYLPEEKSIIFRLKTYYYN